MAADNFGSGGAALFRGLARAVMSVVVCGLICGLSPADHAVAGDIPGVRIETRVDADSVTVGELLRIVHRVSYPDSLEILPPESFDSGTCRLMSVVWREDKKEGHLTREAALEVMTTDLEAAFMPRARFGFITPAADTLTTATRAVDVPVRHLVSESTEPSPLKPQWEAPRSYMWLLLAAAAIVLAGLAIWLFRKRRKREVAGPSKPELPPDFVALRRLDEIERLRLLERGEIKKHYSLVVDTFRTYVEKRFGILAMDETTDEILSDLRENRVEIEGLETILREADLVKFAKHRPDIPVAERLIDLVRGIVARTTPRLLSPEPDAESAAD